MSQSVEEFIEHHGVRGMKWGVRKARSNVKPSSDYKKTAPHRQKHPSELTNKQLKAVNERANLEKNFKQLHPNTNAAKQTLKTLTTGKAVAAEIIGTGALAITAYNMYNSPAGKVAKAAVKNILKKKGGFPSPVATTGWY